MSSKFVLTLFFKNGYRENYVFDGKYVNKTINLAKKISTIIPDFERKFPYLATEMETKDRDKWVLWHLAKCSEVSKDKWGYNFTTETNGHFSVEWNEPLFFMEVK